MFRTSVMVGMGLVLVGCASAPPTAPVDDLDHAKIAAIEKVAMDRGVVVRWVNPPRKVMAKSTAGG